MAVQKPPNFPHLTLKRNDNHATTPLGTATGALRTAVDIAIVYDALGSVVEAGARTTTTCVDFVMTELVLKATVGTFIVSGMSCSVSELL